MPTPPNFSPNTVNQTVEANGATWKGQPGGSWTLQGSGGSSGGGGGQAVTDPLTFAKAAQQMQVEANQPAIQTLNTQKNDLGSKYDDLLKSITASQEPAMNATTLATSNELGRRGISGDSGLAQNTIAQAQLPVSTQFGQLKANAGIQQQQELGSLAAQIASLQAGNVPSALGFSSNVTNTQQQAANVAAQIAEQAREADQQNAISQQGLTLQQQQLSKIGIPTAMSNIAQNYASANNANSNAALNNYQLNGGQNFQGILDQLRGGGGSGSSVPPSYFQPLR